MNIIILGAGQVGATLAETLVHENNDITIIDVDDARLTKLQNRLDIRTVRGFAAHPNVLLQAGCDNADMLIAVTSDDETNIVACLVAYALFHTPTKIARIRSKHYQHHPELFNKQVFPIDMCIHPEELITNTISGLLEHPGALQVINYAEGRIQLVAVTVELGGTFIGKSLSEIHDSVPDLTMRFAAIYRHNHSIEITASTKIEIGDEVFIIAEKKNIKKIIAGLKRLDAPYKRIVIAGGGNIGFHLAQALESNYQVSVIERNRKHCHDIAEHLNEAIVLNGDACDSQLLIDENVESADVFCSLTNDDEANIMSALQAKRLGVRKVLALTTRTAYVEMIEGGQIDIAISPQLITIGSILTYLRRGDTVSVHSLRRGAAEVLEIKAHGDKSTSKVIGRKISEICFPSGVIFGAIIRDKAILTEDDACIEAQDNVIMFLADKSKIKDVEKLFQVGFSYF